MRAHRTRWAALLALAIAAAPACEGDEDPGVAIEIEAVAMGPTEVTLTVRNTGDFTGSLHGCPSGPQTVAQRWDGGGWTGWATLNSSCLAGEGTEYELAPGEEIQYAVKVADGRFRFSVTLRVEGHIGEGMAWSGAVDI